ncbi:chorismate-binding protein [Sphingomicrobium sp. XHP0235]|uniref:chorismate-binding protein n=1 Tax=Sphingomicrobium aquimarinum TaxID=3133971 RepID=UPI0031FE6EDE
MRTDPHILVRRLAGAHDPVTLFAALHGEGAARHFFRRTGGTALILVDAALTLEARENDAAVRATSENGEALIERLSRDANLPNGTRTGDRLAYSFRLPDSDDDEERMRTPSPLDLLRALAALGAAEDDDPYAGALFTLVGFDHVDMAEDLPARAEGAFPDLLATLAETMVVVEPGGAARLIALAAGSDDEARAHRLAHLAAERLARLANRIEQARAPDIAAAEPAIATSDASDEAFAATVRALQENIAAGDIFQVVPSRSFSLPCDDALAAFRRLCALDPSAYTFFAETPHGTLFGASPETAVEVRPGRDRRVVSVSPIAGTRPRGATHDADDRLEADLRLDTKETAEHLMLVDLARNDVARVSTPGTRRVTSLMRVERFARVMHLVSTVEGELAPHLDAIHALRACLNVGTLSGAPKLRAIELIRAHETSARGPYGGAIGVLTVRGAFDSAVVIRSALVRDGEAEVRAGAGVVADSDPAAEAAETRAKASAVLEALGAAA